MPRRPGREWTSRKTKASPSYKREARVLGRRVRQLREQRGWTLERADAVLEINWKYLQKVESGQLNLTLATLCRLAKGYGVSISSLFGGADR